jgi:hypothetical protein
MNRFEMFSAMINRQVVALKGYTGTIQKIELEDGSGHNFNVTLRLVFTQSVVTIFVKG